MRSLAVLALVAVTGCAAIFGSKQKNFDLRSNPGGAEVFLDGARLGTTPFKVNLSNQEEHTFLFKKDGYRDVSCQLAKGTGGGWVVADILMGLVPVIVDAATNSWSQTKGDSCMASMEPAAAAAYQAPAAAPPPEASDAAEAPAPTPREQVPPPATAARADQGTDRPLTAYTEAPPGIAFVGDARIRVFYPLSCAAKHPITVDQQIYFQTEPGAVRDGFRRSGDC